MNRLADELKKSLGLPSDVVPSDEELLKVYKGSLLEARIKAYLAWEDFKKEVWAELRGVFK